uniref:ubiquitinyl hydrolase 1 n=1 Tax=Myxobolus squamalis TaxID=59785 RepID=A0A6B2G8M2_MYXSQ
MTIGPLNDKSIKRVSKIEIHRNNDENESDVSQSCKKKKLAECTKESIEINSADEQERAVLPKNKLKTNKDPDTLRFQIIETMRDGSCLFRAAAHIIYGSQEQHAILREMCVDHIVNRLLFKRTVTGIFLKIL